MIKSIEEFIGRTRSALFDENISVTKSSSDEYNSASGPHSSTLSNVVEADSQNGRNCYKTRVIDVWALGITIVIGGQYFSWNEGLQSGFGSYAIGTVLIGLAYICLCFCTSELSSTFPFAGL